MKKLVYAGLGIGIIGIIAYVAKKKIADYINSDILIEAADDAPVLLKQLLPSPIYRASVKSLIDKARSPGAAATMNKYIKITLVKK